MKLISWNVQWGRGADGRVDLARLVSVLQAENPDVICLQEVAEGFEDLPGGPCHGVLTALEQAFAAHTPVFWPLIDRPQKNGGPKARALFGNMILSRWPVEAVFRRLLPWPAENDIPSMQRGCLEVVLSSPFGPLRVLTTHLEYYSPVQRMAQAQALRLAQQEAIAHHRKRPSRRQKEGPFQAPPFPTQGLLCGDFNCIPGSAPYRHLLKPLSNGPSWQDAWPLCHPESAHAPTVGLHGAEWPDHPYCCDFIFVTHDLANHVVDMGVLADTAASDHQPVWIRLGMPPRV